MSASLGWRIGNSSANAKIAATITGERRRGGSQRTGEARRAQANDSPITPVFGAGTFRSDISRSGRRRAAEQPARREDQHQDQDRKDDHVGPARRDVLAAEA